MISKEEYLELIQPADEEDACPYCGGYAQGGKVSHCVNVFCPSLAD